MIEENHSYAQMREGMPFLADLSDKYGYAAHWTAITHPSEPNYLAIAGGSTFGVTDDGSPSQNRAAVGDAISIFDQAIAAGKSAGTYAQSMPENCYAHDHPDGSSEKPRYAVRHNPWAYFPSSAEACSAHDKNTSSFVDDAKDDQLPNVAFLVPDLDNDAHDGSLAKADAWLETMLGPVLLSDDFTSGRLVVVVTADEDDKSAGNNVLTSVLTPALSGRVVDEPLTHYSLTRYVAQILGVEPLGEAASAPDMKVAFGL